MTRTIARIAIAAALALLAVTAAAAQTFSDARCPVTFHYPDEWTAVVNPSTQVWAAEYKPKNVVCTIALKPPGWDHERKADETGLLRAYPLTIAVVRRPFVEVARKSGFSRLEEVYGDDLPPRLAGRTDIRWMIAVRQGDEPADEFATACCQGVIGDTWGHAWAKDGKVATVTATLAVVNDHQRQSAIFEGQNADRFHAVVEQIAKSLTFMP